jgi:hypothetical protein
MSFSYQTQKEPPHIDMILASGCNDLATVKLKTGDGVLVSDRVRYGTSPEVPDLQMYQCQAESRPSHLSTHPDRLVQASRDDVCLVELKACYWSSVAVQCAMGLPCPHCKSNRKLSGN